MRSSPAAFCIGATGSGGCFAQQLLRGATPEPALASVAARLEIATATPGQTPETDCRIRGSRRLNVCVNSILTFLLGGRHEARIADTGGQQHETGTEEGAGTGDTVQRRKVE